MTGALDREVARALQDSAIAAGAEIAVSLMAERDWASALFDGARLTFGVAGSGERFDGWLAALPEAELPLRRHFIASAEVLDRPEPDRVTVELLAIAGP